MIEFVKDTEESVFYDPTEDRTERVEVEIREDPLTGKTSRILEKPIPINKNPDMSDVEKDGFCPFCPENIEKVGARDVNVLSKEKLEEGEAILLANVTPYSKHSLVIRLTKEHYLTLNEFKKQYFSDAFELIQRYMKKMDDLEKMYPFVLMNYLKPAGSSIVHPHLQLLVSKKPIDYQRRVIESGEFFYKDKGINYWKELLDEERDGPRHIGDTGGFTWISAFAPRGFEHVQGICSDDFLDLEKEGLDGLSQGITNVLSAYADMDYNSFNFSLFIPPAGKDKKFAIFIDMITRSNLDKFYRNDEFSMPKLWDEGYSQKTPEKVAEQVRKYF